MSKKCGNIFFMQKKKKNIEIIDNIAKAWRLKKLNSCMNALQMVAM